MKKLFGPILELAPSFRPRMVTGVCAFVTLVVLTELHVGRVPVLISTGLAYMLCSACYNSGFSDKK